MLRRNGPVVKSVESVLRLEGSLWGERFVEEVGIAFVFLFYFLLFVCLHISSSFFYLNGEIKMYNIIPTGSPFTPI